MITSSSEGLTVLCKGSTLVLELGPHKDNSVLLRGFGAKKGKIFFTQLKAKQWRRDLLALKQLHKIILSALHDCPGVHNEQQINN